MNSEQHSGTRPRTKQAPAMQSRRLTGPGAGVQKYDVLTALGTFALAADRSTQRRILRLITLITARYNWARNELSIGRTDIARLWSVNERTVKRELGALKALGFLLVKRPGARGRVTTYTLDLTEVDRASEPVWDKVGPDFRARMDAQERAGDTVIQFPNQSATPDQQVWVRAKALLRRDDPARTQAWFEPLTCTACRGGSLILKAPSQFHANYVSTHLIGEVIRAVSAIDPALVSAEFETPPT